jgi:hypothetical protein
MLAGADALRTTNAPLSDAAVEEALQSGAIGPLSSAKGISIKLDGLREEQGQRYSQMVADLEAQGVPGPRARDIVDELVKRAADKSARVTDEQIPNMYLREAMDIERKATQPGQRLGLTHAEDIKRYLQGKARSDYARLKSTDVGQGRKDIASVVRQSVEDAIDEAAKAPGASSQTQELAAQFVPVKQRLGRLIEASDAAERGANAAAKRRGFGLTPTIEMAGGVAAGHPVGGAALGILDALAHSRGASTTAAASYRLAQALRSGAMGPDAVRRIRLLEQELAPAQMVPAFAGEDDPLARQHALSQALRRESP